jgi:hypothetical protein
MSELFRYDRERLDDRLLAWVQEHRDESIVDLDRAAGTPGFTGRALVPGVGGPSRIR